jgi:hypothetical protein
VLIKLTEGGRKLRGVLTCEIANKDFTCSHLIEVAHVNTVPWEALRIEHCRAWMHEYSAIFLVEVFDCLCFWVEFHGSGDGRCKFLVREVDSCQLRVESTGTK